MYWIGNYYNEEKPEDGKVFLKDIVKEPLSDRELLELCLNLIMPRRDNQKLSEELIEKFGSFAKVVGAKDNLVMNFPIMRGKNEIFLQLLKELSARVAWQKINWRPVAKGLGEIKDFCRIKIAGSPCEELSLIMLNDEMIPIAEEIHQKGTTNAVYAHPAEITKRAIYHNSHNIIVVHNHPSGDVTPSEEDKILTNMLLSALNNNGINLVDHLVISESDSYSFRDAGMIENKTMPEKTKSKSNKRK